jgi:hypothetical protein
MMIIIKKKKFTDAMYDDKYDVMSATEHLK